MKHRVIRNTYDYVERYIDSGAVEGKGHIGFILDRPGFKEYEKWVLKGVEY